MPIRYHQYVTRDFARAHPEDRFVFGDNIARRGLRGQAYQLRGEPNAIGIATKKAPTMEPEVFFSDNSQSDRVVLFKDVEKVEKALAENRTVWVPTDGIGTGLSDLPNLAPLLYDDLRRWFERHTDKKDKCPWPKSKIA